MSENPVVSIIIPCYNQAHFLSDCLASLLSQTITNWEAIVIDDASVADDPFLVIQKFPDPRIKFIRHSQNLGPGFARNTGVRGAMPGVFLLAVDADDTLHPTFLEKTITYLHAHPEKNCVFTDFQNFGEREGVVKFSVRDLPALLKEQWIPGAGTLFYRYLWEEAGGYCEDKQLIAGNEDWDFYLRLAEIGIEAGHIPEPLYFRRRHGDSLMTRLGYWDYQTRIYIYNNHQHLFDQNELGADFIAEGFLNSIISSIKNRKIFRSVKLFGYVLGLEQKRFIVLVLLVKKTFSRPISYALKKVSQRLRKIKRLLVNNFIRVIYKSNLGRHIFWNYKAKAIDVTWGKSDRHDYDVLRQVITDVSPTRILDVGCGSGRLFPLYRSLKIDEIYGQDISESALAIAKERYCDDNIRLLSTPISQLDFPDNYFDLILSTRVLQLVPSEQIELTIQTICKAGKNIYINEITDNDVVGSVYCYKHDYIKIFDQFGFFEKMKGHVDGQTWRLFEKQNS